MTKTPVRTVSPNGSSDAPQRLGVHERLALIGLIEEGLHDGASESPLVADLFDELRTLVNTTVSGAKIDRLRSDGANGFKVIELNAESGENLGRLHMLYLKKPIPCYYLVYVEVAAPFRNKGLGNRILSAFSSFLIAKSAVGILDNIIPQDDPTYDIYGKLAWQPAEDVIGATVSEAGEVYMVFVPPGMAGKDLRDPVRKLLHHLRRRRAAIDMRDNELMVQRTIEEFKDLQAALMAYFEKQISGREPTPLMRYMFTRFVTKLLGFRRRIGQLLGYTGGESLGQIAIDPGIRSLPIQSYAPRELADKPRLVAGDKELWLNLPEGLKQNPARTIEALPNYRRPSLVSWANANVRSLSDALTIGDLMDLGFDPTRLKEISLGDQDYIFERIQTRMVPQMDQKRELLEALTPQLSGVRVKNCRLRSNPPLLVIEDRGNGYVLRKKVEGIHWEEAIAQLQDSPALKELNKSTRADRMITSTVKQAAAWLGERLENADDAHSDLFSYFVSWNLSINQPKIVVDFFGSYVEKVWIA
jgi:hypothetical protein